MTTIGLFLLKSTITCAILMSWYWLALRNKRLHNYNRFFLLFTMFASIAVPLIHFNLFAIHGVQAKAVPTIPRVVNGYDDGTSYMTGYVPYQTIEWGTILLLIMAAISTVLFALLTGRVIWLIRTSKKYQSADVDGIKLIYTDLPKAPFSFINLLFWKDTISPET